jgi:hypothetical protein
MEKQDKDRLTIYLPEKLKWDAKKLAAEQHKSVTEMIVELLEREMEKQPQPARAGR